MKLQTSIKPRRDGTVRATGVDGKTVYVFAPDEVGELVADVDCEQTVAMLLGTGQFEPVDPADFDKAGELVKPHEEDEDEVDDDEDDGDMNAMPVEANTPPARKGRGRKTKAE